MPGGLGGGSARLWARRKDRRPRLATENTAISGSELTSKAPRKKAPRKRNKPAEPTLDRAEAIEILEEIAREGGNAAARIAAIKQLEAMRDGEQQAAEGFDKLG